MKRTFVSILVLTLSSLACQAIQAGFAAPTPTAAPTSIPTFTPTVTTANTAPAQTFRRYDIPTDGFYSSGPKDAPITIVEFSDFQCPFCKRWHDQVYQPLLAAYPGKIRFVYRNLPLVGIHPQAMTAAEASLCAGEQNVYWQYHDKLFESQDSLGDNLYAQLARDLNLDMVAFQACMTSHKYQSEIQNDMNFALGLGVQSTPTFFINGLAVVGAQPLTVFAQIIDQELAGEIPQ
jgi:protein-disulfide isomerase